MTTQLNQQEYDFEIVNESDLGPRQAETVFPPSFLSYPKLLFLQTQAGLLCNPQELIFHRSSLFQLFWVVFLRFSAEDVAFFQLCFDESQASSRHIVKPALLIGRCQDSTIYVCLGFYIWFPPRWATTLKDEMQSKKVWPK